MKRILYILFCLALTGCSNVSNSSGFTVDYSHKQKIDSAPLVDIVSDYINIINNKGVFYFSIKTSGIPSPESKAIIIKWMEDAMKKSGVSQEEISQITTKGICISTACLTRNYVTIEIIDGNPTVVNLDTKHEKPENIAFCYGNLSLGIFGSYMDKDGDLKWMKCSPNALNQAEEALIANGLPKHELSNVKNLTLKLGMSRLGMYAVMGRPEDVNTTTTEHGASQQYVFGKFPKSTYVYVENGKVTGWQD